MAAFWAVFTSGGSGPDITAHGSLDLKQEIQIQIQTTIFYKDLQLVTTVSLGLKKYSKQTYGLVLNAYSFTALMTSLKRILEVKVWPW
jgi:hypothetical protein